jgi:hypothetical protein
MSWYMEKTFGTYRRYPSRWDGALTLQQNNVSENYEPGYASNFNVALEVDDSTIHRKETLASIPYDVSYYPDWYQPKVLDLAAVIEGPLT